VSEDVTLCEDNSVRLRAIISCHLNINSNITPPYFLFSLSISRVCDNIYIGFGHKYSSINYCPPVIPPLAAEYPSGSDVIEDDDPTAEEEAEALLTRKVSREDNISSADEDEVDTK
jgi:Radial spokehead-like protein